MKAGNTLNKGGLPKLGVRSKHPPLEDSEPTDDGASSGDAEIARKRLNLILTRGDYNRLAHLRNITGARSVTAVINLAVETFELLLEQRGLGREVFVRGQEGEMLVPIRSPLRRPR
jgi:hypothetical protein